MASCLALAPLFLRPKVSPAGSRRRRSHSIPYLLARQLFKIQQQMTSVLVPLTSDSLLDRSWVGPSWAAQPTASNLGFVLISSSCTSHRSGGGASENVPRNQATGTLRAEIILSAGPDALGLSLSSSAGHIHSARTSEPMPHTYNCGHCQRHKLKKNSFHSLVSWVPEQENIYDLCHRLLPTQLCLGYQYSESVDGKARLQRPTAGSGLPNLCDGS